MTNLHTWFECKVKLVRTGEDGKETKVSETRMLDCINYSDAEAKIYEIMEQLTSSNFKIAGIKPSNISEIIESDIDNDDKYFKAKVSIFDADELTGKSKRTNQYVLIAARDIMTALEYVTESFNTYVVPFEVVQIQDTSIIDVFPYITEE